MLRMLNRYRDDLGVVALPQELSLAADRTEAHLREATAVVSVANANVTEGRLEVDVDVRNATGHKFPTAYPSRRAWLHLSVNVWLHASIISKRESPRSRVSRKSGPSATRR